MKYVDPSEYRAFVGEPITENLGVAPRLDWVPIGWLRIDPAYQREVLRQGARNIGRIAREFDWSLFGIVVVAEIEGGLYAIVDGQHRTLGAALRGIEAVPCLIIEADLSKQAKAFAAINGAVTKIHGLAIFAAEVAAGLPAAIALRDACDAAEVTICKYPVPANNMKPNETLAIGTLQRCLKTYGSDHLTVALRCVTQTRRGEVGHLREPTIKALCHVLEVEPSWKEPENRLLKAMEKFDFAKELEKATVTAKQQRNETHTVLGNVLFAFLDAELGVPA
ncbi:DUF6551 family protein [Mesorhizobium silamurunense]|uniref:DUF6551 family protein n=1 Tax=Mesorhizobium silamurunense TaxID=499528 RepID=UPI00177B5EBF|nr:DUF6551 family protein [Mesorhizobium silamurunense]